MFKTPKESKSNIGTREKNVMEIVDNEYTEIVLELDNLKNSIAYLQDRLFYKSLNENLIDDTDINSKVELVNEHYKKVIEMFAELGKQETIRKSGLIITPSNMNSNVRE